MNFFLRIQDGLYFCLDFPLRIWNLVHRLTSNKGLFSNDAITSDSGSTYYSHFVSSAADSDRVFKKFRRSFHYRQILEHVDYKLGYEYMTRLSKQSIQDLTRFPDVVALSSVGSPRRFYFKQFGLISPTIIRYQFVCQELKKHFGESIGLNVTEIGVGFGGQYAILNNTFEIGTYNMFDLPQVMKLTHKLLRLAGVETSKIHDGDIREPITQGCDMVISNYAFSELPRDIQTKYIEGVMVNSCRGYLIMNSGRTNTSGRSLGKYTLEELKRVLPDFEVLEEDPLTGPDNYVIIWGHNRETQ